ncbi:hypothetical protein [Pyrodictium abyssi]|uniref:ArsR family transcriptional regulator n=1 Tax=Pyrodictium abyssi TaxID=54256 RepID=A0ABM8IV44_9CREN|nr:hypothetical protein PABY_09980 [Pyrodictium abyssi]
MSRQGIDIHVEDMLMKADRQVLRTLSPRARCIVLALRVMEPTGVDIADLETRIESFGFRCIKLNEVLYMLSYHGIVECMGRVCRLTDAGAELSAALSEFLANIRRLAHSVIEGSVDEDDVLSSLVTAFASTLGLIESYVEEPTLMPLYLSLHMYITGLSTAVLAQLARVSATVLDTVKRFTEGYGTE